jgi:hypothetical protein
LYIWQKYILADTTVPTTMAVPDVSIMTPKDFEAACKQPVIVGTLISTLALLPLNMLAMYALFTKLDKMFNPHRLLADYRRPVMIKRIANK